jgi:pimeloyl-CoA synthetase
MRITFLFHLNNILGSPTYFIASLLTIEAYIEILNKKRTTSNYEYKNQVI